MTITYKGYQSDFGMVPADKMPKDIWAAFANAPLTKVGNIDARTRAGKAAIEAKEQLDRMIWEAWNKADKQTLHKLGLKYV
jgi:hypothetical protein